MSEAEIVDAVRAYCSRNSINVSRGIALTIQKTKSTVFASVIIDFTNDKVLRHYPLPDHLIQYKEKMLSNISICYNDTIKPDELVINEIDVNSFPQTFPCCSRITATNPRRLERDSLFNDFLREQGHHPTTIFELKATKDCGALVYTKYFKIEHGRRVELDIKPKR
ncbi:hypothetical protein GEMRC1_006662 [Eukaryota sp. GEM-RC1]